MTDWIPIWKASGKNKYLNLSCRAIDIKYFHMSREQLHLQRINAVVRTNGNSSGNKGYDDVCEHINNKVKTAACSDTIELQKKKTAYLSPFDSCVNYCDMVSKSINKVSRKLCDNDEIADEEVSSDKLNFITDNRKSVRPKRLIDSKAIFSILQKARPWESNHTKSETLDILWKYVHFIFQASKAKSLSDAQKRWCKGRRYALAGISSTILGKIMLSLQPIRVQTQWMIYLILPLKK